MDGRTDRNRRQVNEREPHERDGDRSRETETNARAAADINNGELLEAVALSMHGATSQTHTHTTLAPIKGLPVRVYPTTRPLLVVALLRLISRARAHLTLLPPPVRRRGAKSGRLLSVGVSADWLAGIECANCFAAVAAAATDAPSAGVHHSSSLQPVLWFPRFPLRRWSRARKRANAKQADDEAKAAAAAATAASCCCSLGHCLSIQFSLLLAVGTQKQMLQAAPPNEPAGWPAAAAAEEAI